MSRYITKWYTTTSQAESKRLAAIDHTPSEKIQFTPDVNPVHVAESWILWSDGKFTTSIGSHLPPGGRLSTDAVRLISTVRGSDTGYVESGLLALTKIKEILQEELIEIGTNRGVYAPEKITQIRILSEDDEEDVFYVYSAGYFEGYQYDVYQSLESLKARLSPAPPVTGLTDVSDFEYDSDLGYHKKDTD